MPRFSSAVLKQPRVVGAAVAVVAAAVYLNALGNGLVWDDPIVLTRQLLAFRSLHDLIFLPRNIPQFSPDYYRPLTVASYLLDRQIGGASPFVFHLSVVLYHVITTALVFAAGLVLFGGVPQRVVAAGLGAMLFAVHPIHSESVAWGAGRSDVLACGLSLAGLLVYGRPQGRAWQRSALAAALVFLATLAKETAVVLFVLVPATDLLRAPPSRSSAAGENRAQRRRAPAPPLRAWTPLPYAPFAVLLIVYFGLRHATLGSTLGPTTTLSGATLPRMSAAVGVYLGKLVVPVYQNAYISELPSGVLVHAGTAAAVVLLGAIALRAWQRGERVVSFLIGWIGITIAPSLVIVFKIPSAPVAERYLYLPSVGFCLLLGYWIARLAERPSRRAAILAAFTAVCALAGIATVRRNAVWRSNLSLWQDTVVKNTSQGLPARSLGTAYQEKGDAAQAFAYFQLALQRHNDPAGLFTIHNNLGSLAMAAHKLDDAERSYRAALANNPQAADAIFNLGLIALTRAREDDSTRDAAWRRAQAEQARQLFAQAEQLSPLDPDIQVGLGQTFSTLGDAAAARQHLERALQLGVSADTATAVRRLLADLQ